jgi:hypothetical protein
MIEFVRSAQYQEAGFVTENCIGVGLLEVFEAARWGAGHLVAQERLITNTPLHACNRRAIISVRLGGFVGNRTVGVDFGTGP